MQPPAPTLHLLHCVAPLSAAVTDVEGREFSHQDPKMWPRAPMKWGQLLGDECHLCFTPQRASFHQPAALEWRPGSIMWAARGPALIREPSFHCFKLWLTVPVTVTIVIIMITSQRPTRCHCQISGLGLGKHGSPECRGGG